jgi:hypothetical protein
MASRGSNQRVVEEVIRQAGKRRNLSSGVGLGIRLGATSRRGLNVLLLFAQLSAAGIADGAGAGVNRFGGQGLFFAAPAAAAAV